MVNEIIKYINLSLSQIKGVNNVFGVCEILEKETEDTVSRFPAIYKDSGNYDYIQFEQDVLYHRFTGDKTFEYLDESFTGNQDPRVILRCPLRVVACVDRESCSTENELADIISKTLGLVNYKPLKQQLKFQNIYLRVNSVTTDRFQLWGEETENAGLSADFDYVFIAVNYSLEITTLLSCLSDCNYSFEFACDDSVILLNGEPFLIVKSGSTTNIELVDQNDEPIIPESVVNNKITVSTGGGEIPVKNTDNSFTDTAFPPEYIIQNTDIILKNSADNIIGGGSFPSCVEGELIAPDASAVLKDTAGATLSTNPLKSGETKNITAPNSTVNLNGGAFLSPKSNETVNVLLRNQDGNQITPSSVSGSQINITEERNTLMRFVFQIGIDTSSLYTIFSGVNNGTYTATTNDGSSGTITFSKNGGAYAAFSNPLVLAAGDTIQIKRTIVTAAGFVQISGTY